MSHTAKRLSRRRFLEMGCATVVAASLVGCSPREAPLEPDVTDDRVDEAEAAVPAEQVVTIRYGMHSPVTGREATHRWFSDENPNIKVELEQIGEFHTRIYAAAAADTLPDVTRMWEAMVLDMGRHQQVIDLNPFIDVTPDFDPEDFYEAWWDYPVIEGKRFGIGDAVAPHVTFYNMELFDAGGVPYPDRDQFTWNDFEERARALRDPDNRVWGSETIPIGWHYFSWKQVRQHDGDFFSPDYRECWIDRPEAIEALQYWADLLQDGNVMPSPTQIAGIGGDGVAAELFGAGNIGMQRDGVWNVSHMADVGMKFNIAFEPSSVRRDTITHGAFNAISASTRHREECWTWITYDTSTQGIYNYSLEGRFPGVRRSSNEIVPHPWVLDVGHEVDWDVVPESVAFGNILPGPANEGEALRVIGDALEEIYAGISRAADILPEIAPRVTEIITDY